MSLENIIKSEWYLEVEENNKHSFFLGGKFVVRTRSKYIWLNKNGEPRKKQKPHQKEVCRTADQELAEHIILAHNYFISILDEEKVKAISDFIDNKFNDFKENLLEIIGRMSGAA